jgi:putative transposase
MQEWKHVSRNRVSRLMGLMGIEAIYPKPKLSIGNKEHKKYPYLLNSVCVERPNQVWCTDITYIPTGKGFVYLVAIMDWHSRFVLSYEISNSMESSFCAKALERAIAKYGAPEIFNSDQGAQFTDHRFTDVLERHGVRISMDGKGRCMDNIFIERLWRSVKYEEVYLKGYETLPEARAGLREYFRFYNDSRPHQSLDYKTPSEVHFGKGQGDLPPETGAIFLKSVA